MQLQNIKQKKNYKMDPPFGYGGNLSYQPSAEKLLVRTIPEILLNKQNDSYIPRHNHSRQISKELTKSDSYNHPYEPMNIH